MSQRQTFHEEFQSWPLEQELRLGLGWAPMKRPNHAFLLRLHLWPPGSKIQFSGGFFLHPGSVTQSPYFSRSVFWKFKPGEATNDHITRCGYVE